MIIRTILLTAIAAAPLAAGAMVIRHDVPDAAYLARESEFPALFGIYRTKAGYKDCIATLVATRWAVTAAHCARDKSLLEGASAKGYPVVVAGHAATIDKIVHHPKIGDDRAPDVALLRFASPITHVSPIALYRESDEVGRIVVMPGWGGTGNGKTGLGPEDGLFRVTENLVDRADSGQLWWKFDAPGPNSRVLTLEGISGPGDSGGPALISTRQGWALAGVSSSQNTMGGPEGHYGVEEAFVRVSAVAGWIDRTINQ